MARRGIGHPYSSHYQGNQKFQNGSAGTGRITQYLFGDDANLRFKFFDHNANVFMRLLP